MEKKKTIKSKKAEPKPKVKAKPTAKAKPAVKKVEAKKSVEDPDKIRYNDKELQEFKIIILNKLEEAKRDLILLTEAYTTKNDHDTNDTSPTFKVLEEGSNVLSKEENSQLAARQQKFIRDLESALLRIENKTYGVCRVTGKLIPKERLKIVPHATMSIEAKLGQQKINR
jgi:RNA polymerase-binding transcription factor DksA